MKVRTILLCALIGAAPYIVATPYASAQASPPPTVPCPSCGPSGTKLPSGNARAWSYPEHRCILMGGVNSSAFNLVFGLNAAYPNPVTFTATVDDVATATPLVTVPLGILTPGQQRTTGTIVTVLPNTTITMKVSGRDTVTGAPVKFGDGTLVKTSQLTCDCVQPPRTPPTTVVTSSSTVPATVATTPGTPPATPPRGPSVPGVTTPHATVPGQNFELPATGGTSNTVAVAVLFLCAGLGCWLIARKRTNA